MATLGNTALLKQAIEDQLARRIPAALSPLVQQAPRLFSVGNGQIDELLGGGLPLGSVCEVTGPDASGRSSIALSLLASASREGACAYIDVDDTLSPHSAAAAGVHLGNLLWVRFAQPIQTSTGSRPTSAPPKQAFERQDCFQQNGGSPHPRSETKGLAAALEQTFRVDARPRAAEGTPGSPNRPLGLAAASPDQIEWERFNLRKADESDPLRVRNKEAAVAARRHAAGQPAPPISRFPARPLWDRLGRALRAADQVLQSGGFRVVVFDLASAAAEQTMKIPLATWFRFRKAAQESDALLLVLTRQACAQSSAACVLECSAAGPPTIQGVFAAAAHRAEIARQRTAPPFGKKHPGRTAGWSTAPAWMRAAGS